MIMASIFAFKVEIVLGRETQIYGRTIIATFSLFAALFCASSRDNKGHWEGILAEMKAF